MTTNKRLMKIFKTIFHIMHYNILIHIHYIKYFIDNYFFLNNNLTILFI